jgi:deoxycytidine triphosphate deaminase
MLTGKQLTTFISNVPDENIQQHGIDLNVVSVSKVISRGLIPKEGKTILGQREEIKPMNRILDFGVPPGADPMKRYPENEKRGSVLSLDPGVYDFVFAQGCKVPKDSWFEVIQRSSGSRNGLFIRSAIFDAGFQTEQIGTMVMVLVPIDIEVGARVAQIVAHNSNEVENQYNGQWQGDQQRKN